MSKFPSLTPEEQQAAYDRAREVVEQITPLLVGKDAGDVLTALQLLMARTGLQLKLRPEDLLLIQKVNLPQFYGFWEDAAVDVETGYKGPPTTA